MRATRALCTSVALVVLAAGLSACGPHGGSSALPQTPAQTNPYNGDSGFIYASDFLAQSHYLKPAHFDSMGFDVIVRLQNPNGLEQFANSLGKPGTSSFRKFLTPDEVSDRYLASQSDYATATKYLQKFGLKVTGWNARMLLFARGSQRQWEAAFGTRFGYYQHGTEQFIAPITAPHVPKGVPIVGSLDIVQRTKLFFPSKKHITNGLTSGYSPQQIQLVFDYAGAYNANMFGAGITIGIIGTGPVSLNTASHVGDLEAMRALYGAQGKNTITLAPVIGTRDGLAFAAPPPVTATTSKCNEGTPGSITFYPPSESPLPDCNPEDGEAQIDTEQTALLAPNATVLFYLGYVPKATVESQTGTLQGLPVWPEELEQAISDNTADVLSISFGGDEPSGTPQYYAPLKVLFQTAVAQGIAVFASSGDNGAYACQDGLAPKQYINDLCVSYPATDQNVTAVGGVNTPITASGQLDGPLTAWGETTSGGIGGTGGGVSSIIAMPQYQILCPSTGCQPMDGMQAGGRNVPDVSLEADPLTGVATVLNADKSIGPREIAAFGGTSVAAPEMAAQWALLLGVCKAKAGGFCGATAGPPGKAYRLGNADTTLYPLYENLSSESGKQVITQNVNYDLTFYDVLFGTNGQCFLNPNNPSCPPPTFLPGFDAGVGYDLTTGLGVPYARALIHTVSGT